ncbi:MAG TPA: hypothetical protein VF867_14095 [Arthrobacter sp.]
MGEFIGNLLAEVLAGLVFPLVNRIRIIIRLQGCERAIRCGTLASVSAKRRAKWMTTLDDGYTGSFDYGLRRYENRMFSAIEALSLYAATAHHRAAPPAAAGA